jgi:hypothetical protein
LVNVMPLPDSGHGLEVEYGATPVEVALSAVTMPPASFVSFMSNQRHPSGVVLLFRRFPDGVPDPAAPAGGGGGGLEAMTVPGGAVEGWVPDLSKVERPTPDLGLTPYGVAMAELLGAVADLADRALVLDLVVRADPRAVVALAEVLRQRRACGGGR